MRLIDADALVKEANTDGAYGYVDVAQIEAMPTIDPESLRPQGEWIHEGDGWDECWKCSACKEHFAFDYDPTDEETFVKYCPDCGAKMGKGMQNDQVD